MKIPPKITAKAIDIYMHAEGVGDAAVILNRAPPQLRPSIGYSIVVLQAFAAELYFKCLIRLDEREPPIKHDLQYLFELQTPAVQSKIEKIWNDIIVPMHSTMWGDIDRDSGGEKIRRDLMGALAGGRDAFRRVRYIYEGSEGIEFFLGDLPEILRTIILEMRPDWARLRRRARALPTSHNH